MEYEVQAAVSALGFLEGTKYRKEADCLETIKDLIRYLRRDNENFLVRRQLCESNVVAHDLVPIIMNYSDDADLFDPTLRLLINLTQPLPQLFKNRVGIDAQSNDLYNKIRHCLAESKRCFVNEKFCAVLVDKMEKLIDLEWEDLAEDDRLMLERLFSCLRNILSLPNIEEEKLRTDFEVNVHDQIIQSLCCAGIVQCLVKIASSTQHRFLHLVTLEIVTLILKEHKPEQLVLDDELANSAEKERADETLKELHAKQLAKRAELRKRCSGRPTNFAGFYVVNGLKALADDRSVVSPKVVASPYDLTFQERKRPKKSRLNKSPAIASDAQQNRVSSRDVRRHVGQLCQNFLQNSTSFETLLKSTIHSLKSSDRRLYTIELCYLRFVRFFLEFARFKAIATKSESPIKCILPAMTVHNVHYVLTEMTDFFEMISIEKHDAAMWGSRLHTAVQCYKEILYVLNAMDKSSDENLIDYAMEMKQHMFKVVEYGEIFIELLKKFSTAANSKQYLADLFETIHVYMKIFEVYCDVHGGGVKIGKKRRKRRKKVEKSKVESIDKNEEKQEDKNKIWDRISADLSAVLQGHVQLPDDVIPFDVLAEHGFDEKLVAQVRMQEALKNGHCDVAVALLRASRELWPDDTDIFGPRDLDSEAEFLLLRHILFADFPQIPGENDELVENLDISNNDAEDLFDAEGQNEMIEDEEDDDQFETREVELTFLSYLQRFSHGSILKWYVWLLHDFESNEPTVNHAILRLLYRVAYQLKSAASLYQASLLRVFHKMSKIPGAKNIKAYKELHDFAKHFLRGFFEHASSNPAFYVEILCWKHAKETYELEHGYGTYESKKKQAVLAWTEELDNELTAIYNEFMALEEKPLNDVIEYIQSKLSRMKSRRALGKRLKRLNLGVPKVAKIKNKKRKSRANFEEIRSEIDIDKNTSEETELIDKNSESPSHNFDPFDDSPDETNEKDDESSSSSESGDEPTTGKHSIDRTTKDAELDELDAETVGYDESAAESIDHLGLNESKAVSGRSIKRIDSDNDSVKSGKGDDESTLHCVNQNMKQAVDDNDEEEERKRNKKRRMHILSDDED